MKKLLHASFALLGAGLIALTTPHAYSDQNWDGDANNLWNLGVNWSGNTVPNNEAAIIDNPTNAPVVLNTATNSVTTLLVGSTTTVALTLNTSAILNVTGPGFDMLIGNLSGGNGTVTLDGNTTLLTLDAGNGTLGLGLNAGSSGTFNFGAGGTAGTLNAAVIGSGAGVGTVNFNNTDPIYFLATQIVGSTVFNMNGTGLVFLGAANTYSGLTTINSGTLAFTGDTSGLGGNIVNHSAVVFAPGTDSSFNNVISGEGTLRKAGGNGTLTLSAVNTYSGLTTIDTGTLAFTNDTSFLGGNIQDNSALVFNQAMNSSFNQAINGAGTLTKTGAGTLRLTGVSSVGDTAVNGGTLLVNNFLQATRVDVARAATLGGRGTIASNVTNNGTLAPGDNGTGTLRVNGNYTQSSTGVFQLQIASASDFDRLLITGRATLAGLLNAVAINGFKPKMGQQITFLTADGGISGKFDSVTNDMGNHFRSRFFIKGDSVILVFAPSSYTQMAQTENQKHVAGALDHYINANGDRGKVSLALDQLSAGEYGDAFDQISPALYESLANITIEQTNAQNQMLAQRLSSLRLGTTGFSVSGLDQAALSVDRDGKSVMDAKSGKDIISQGTATKWSVWVQGNGIFARVINVSQVPNYRFNSGGFLIGVDYKFGGDTTTTTTPGDGKKAVAVTTTTGSASSLVVGMYGGYQGTEAIYDANGGRLGLNSALFGVYASYTNGGFYSDLILGGGYNAYQVRRTIDFGSIDRTAHSDPTGGTVTSYLDLGYDWKVGGFTFGPLLSGQYTYAGIGATQETGADSLDLGMDQQNANSIRTNIGGRVAYTWQVTDSISLVPEGRMFWQHEYLNGPRTINSSLDGGGGPSFDYETSAPGRDSVFAGAGVTANFGPNWSTYVYYNADFGRQDFVSHMVSAGLNWKF